MLTRQYRHEKLTLDITHLESETFGRWLFAAGKHIAQFRSDMPIATQVWATRRTSQEVDLLLRLRQLGTISGTKAIAYAQDVGIAPQEAVLATWHICSKNSSLSKNGCAK